MTAATTDKFLCDLGFIIGLVFVFIEKRIGFKMLFGNSKLDKTNPDSRKM